jgi:hypothetical protein
MDVDTTRNAIQMAHQAFEIGTGTLQTLQNHNEQLQNVGRNLNRTAYGTETISRNLKVFKPTNRMFPFLNHAKARRHERQVSFDKDNYHLRREKRDELRAAKWHFWKQAHIHRFVSIPLRRGATGSDILARVKYQFEENSDDEALDAVLEGNQEELVRVAEALNSPTCAWAGRWRPRTACLIE